jgi:iron complex transport system substrate-binding protein
MRRHMYAAALAAALAAVTFALSPAATSAAAKSAPITLRDDTGATVTLRAPARRIVSLISSDTQIVLALGLRRRLVGVDLDSISYMAPPYAALAKGLPTVGNSYPAPSLERIVKARPDLILSSSAVADNAKLRALGIPVLVLSPSNLAGIEHDIQLVGEATGSVLGARRLVARIQTSVARLRAHIRSTGSHPTVYVEIGSNPYYSVGPGSYIDSLLTLLGAQNVVDRTAKVAYPEVSSETVVALDPQVIVLDEPGVTPAQVDARPGWQVIAAVKDHRVYANVNVNALSEPGPAVLTALWQMARDLYPGAVGG